MDFLGVGVGLRGCHLDELPTLARDIDCLEITLDHYFYPYAENIEMLQVLNQRFPLMCHALKTSIGSAEGVNEVYLDNISHFMRDIPNVEWFSEHMSFCKSGGLIAPHFLPIPYNDESLEVVVRNIKEVQRKVDKTIIFENIPYDFEYPETQMHEGEFFSKVIEKTGCGLLLDVTNLYANSINLGFEVYDYLEKYPLDSVVQLHFNGGEYKGKRYIDSHRYPTPPDVWDIVEMVFTKAKPRAAVLERDDGGPLADLVPEMQKARELIRKCGVKI